MVLYKILGVFDGWGDLLLGKGITLPQLVAVQAKNDAARTTGPFQSGLNEYTRELQYIDLVKICSRVVSYNGTSLSTI